MFLLLLAKVGSGLWLKLIHTVAGGQTNIKYLLKIKDDDGQKDDGPHSLKA